MYSIRATRSQHEREQNSLTCRYLPPTWPKYPFQEVTLSVPIVYAGERSTCTNTTQVYDDGKMKRILRRKNAEKNKTVIVINTTPYEIDDEIGKKKKKDQHTVYRGR